VRQLGLTALWTRNQVHRMQGMVRPLGSGSRFRLLFYWEHIFLSYTYYDAIIVI
jgi:hypothetical protein